MKKYTVLVLWPDYVANDLGQDTYLTHVYAIDAIGAQETAQKEAAYYTGSPGSEEYDDDLEPSCASCAVLAVFKGHLQDLKEES